MTAAAAGSSKPLNRFNACARWMSHYSMWFVAWFCGTSTATAFIPYGQLQDILTVTWFFLAFLPVAVSYYGDQVHMRAWDCPTCVAKVPILNGELEATRLNKRLGWMHRGRRLLTVSLGTLSLAIVSPLLIEGPCHELLALPWYAVWFYSCMASEAHRNLRPWCPWCRRNDGGAPPIDVIPPTPAGRKTHA